MLKRFSLYNKEEMRRWDNFVMTHKTMTGIWKHLPEIIVDRVGPVLMKQLAGIWLCRD